MSSIYTHTADSTKSLEYIQKGLAFAEESPNDDLKCRTLMNYANELLNKGQLSKVQDVLNKTEPILLKLQNTAYSQYFFI